MTRLVGVLNVTPDSFSDGGLYLAPHAALERAEQLFAEGAYLVDVGAESTKPGAEPLTSDEEWARLEPILPVLLDRYPGRISLDTYHPETADRALHLGELIINDITGMNNQAMIDVVVAHRAPVIVSHLPNANPQAEKKEGILLGIDDEPRIVEHLLGKKALLVARGLDPGRIIIDPGIGFAKKPELNWHLLDFPQRVPGHAVMLGYSRKRFLGDDRMKLEANLGAGRRAIDAGAAYLRVHDVAGHRRLPGITVD